ncbi:hypothetical protein [Pseudonocardia sp. KRD291]|uniref:hypothetical protein n=1 Tax=Pseudonocardia sp. KRD291 TaxID=2792007 RepID=UPI001C4A6767|nr:hypothetical protein [Pseudonocardia sp. KRD291]MBW0102776.1 hypothetical protein [Pseudonocardia sp. KRD291]
MTADEQHQWKQPPPPRPRRRNALVLRLYDAPIHRDGLAWWTAISALVWFVIIATNTQPTPSTLPRWLDGLLAAVVMTGLLAVLPAAARLQFRRLRWRQRERQRQESGPVGPPAVAPREARSSPLDQPATRVTARPYGPPPPTAGPSTEHRVQVPSPGPAGARPPATPVNRVARPAPEQPTANEPAPVRPDPPTPTPPLSEEAIARSAVFRDARALQYPVARAIRTLQAARHPQEQYVAALDAADALSITLGISGAAWLNASGADPQALAELGLAYNRGVTQGTWVTVARKAAKAAARSPDAPPGFAAFAQRPTKDQLARLDDLIQERNRSAHGQRPRTQVEATQRLSSVIPALEAALTGAAHLAHSPWIVTVSSSYRIQERTFDVSARRVMSDHPEFEPGRWSVGTPLADERVYMVPDGGTPIDLTPFAVARPCATCLQQEIFYSDKLPPREPTVLKSFGSTHVTGDRALDDEIRRLSSPLDT